MSHHITANYTMPAVVSPIKPSSTSTTGTGTTNTGSSTSSTSSSDIGTTFLSLLTQELQNQDPTAPMDSTAMVGQMISLNQLAELTSINQAVGGSATSVTGAMQPSTSAKSAIAQPAQSTSTTLAANQLPFDPSTMMPVASSTSTDTTQPAIRTSTPK